MSEPYWVPLSGGPVYLPNPSARAYTGGFSIPHAVATPLTLAEWFDTDGMWNAPNPQRLTFQTAGKYIITGHIGYAISSAGQQRRASIRRNSTAPYLSDQTVPITAISLDHQVNVAVIDNFVPGDYVELLGYQDSGAAMTVSGELAAARVDAALPTTLPPVAGGELAYAEITAAVTITATSEAGANTIITLPPITFDGATPVIVEFNSEGVTTPAAVGAGTNLLLFQDGASIGYFVAIGTPAAAVLRVPVHAGRRLTPSAGSHIYSIRGFVTTASGTVIAGAGGLGADRPAWARIVRT